MRYLTSEGPDPASNPIAPLAQRLVWGIGTLRPRRLWCAAGVFLLAASPLLAQPRIPPQDQPGEQDADLANPDDNGEINAEDFLAPEDADDVVEFSQFSEPVDLQVLVDFVSKELQRNIMVTDTGLAGQQVVFRAPMSVRKRDLLDLLQIFLQQSGYSLTQDENGWLIIRPAGEIPVDLKPGQLATTQVFPTPLIRPSSVRAPLDSLLPADQGQSRKIAYVDELGVIISTATPRTNRSIEQLIRLIVEGREQQELERFDLTHIAATEAQERILALTGQPGGQSQQRGGEGGAQANVSGLSNVADRLVVDRQGNSLIFRGDRYEINRVSELIQLVDKPSRLIIRQYAAGPMARTIANYGARMGLGPVDATGGGGQATGRPGAAGGSGQTTGGSGFVIENEEAGVFSYYGTSSQHEQVEMLIEEYADRARAERIVVEFYKLQNANALDIADLLAELMDLEGSGRREADSPFLPDPLESQRGITRVEEITGQDRQAARRDDPIDGGAEGQDEEGATLTPAEGIAIIPYEAQNQLMIRAPTRQQAEFARIIEQLDRRRPQVLIDVQIVSISKSESFFLTIETALDAIGPNSNPIFSNFGFRGSPFQTTIPETATGLTAAVIRSEYIPFILNTLATEGNGRIISNPTLLVNDNEPASVASTRDEPFSQTSQVTGAPSTTAFGGNASAGTTVNVTPQISDGGFLVLEFSIELSSFDARSNPDLPPPQNSNNFESVVTIPSDSTVVIGGFQQRSIQTSVQKIPLLGDIPLLGLLFQESTEDESSSTIYVFITPRVLNDPTFADLRLLSEGPMAELDLDPLTPRLDPVSIPLFGRMDISPDDGVESPAMETTIEPIRPEEIDS